MGQPGSGGGAGEDKGVASDDPQQVDSGESACQAGEISPEIPQVQLRARVAETLQISGLARPVEPAVRERVQGVEDDRCLPAGGGQGVGACAKTVGAQVDPHACEARADVASRAWEIPGSRYSATFWW